MRRPIVFFDFDNTITTIDVIDDILIKFSKDDKWLSLEEKWKRGRIGSRQCLKGQVEGIRVTRDALNKYLKTIKLDAYFKKLLKLLRSKKIKTLIVSDNFSYIVKRVLKNNGITSAPAVYCNTVRVTANRLVPSFPYSHKKCGNCAHCKRITLMKNIGKGHTSFYVGDGLSDVCASKHSDIVFAKGYLRRYLKKKKITHIPIDNLKGVYDYFRRIYNEPKTENSSQS